MSTGGSWDTNSVYPYTATTTGTNVTDMTIFFPPAPSASTPKTNVEWLRSRVSEICELAQAQ